MLIESKPRFYSPQNKSVVAEDSPEIRGPSYIFANSIWALRASIVLDFIQAELCWSEMFCGLADRTFHQLGD